MKGGKPSTADLPLEALIRIAREATQRAARDAVAAGRSVAGWEQGRVVLFGPGKRTLSSARLDSDAPDER